MAAATERGSGARLIRTNYRSPGLLRQMYRHRSDYLYVLPALGVMFLVIGYPIYYTFYLSLFNTPPSLAMAEQDLRRSGELPAYSAEQQLS